LDDLIGSLDSDIANEDDGIRAMGYWYHQDKLKGYRKQAQDFITANREKD